MKSEEYTLVFDAYERELASCPGLRLDAESAELHDSSARIRDLLDFVESLREPESASMTTAQSAR